MRHFGGRPFAALVANWGPPDKSIHGKNSSAHEYRSRSRRQTYEYIEKVSQVVTCRATVHVDSEGFVTTIDLDGDAFVCEYLVPLGPEFTD